MAGFPFVICYRLQALPHTTSVRVGVIGLHLPHIFSFCVFEVSSEVVAGFLVYIHVHVSFLGVALTFSSAQILPVIYGFWSGYILTVTVRTTTSMRLLMKPVTVVINSLMLTDESRHISQCCILTYASSNHFHIEGITGTSCLSF